MIYEDRVLCFVDILGFKSHIQRTLDDKGASVSSNITNIAEAFTHVRKLLDIDKPDKARGRAATQFSDSIVISFPKGETSEVFYSVHELLLIQMSLVENGMLCRGAVVDGKVLHTEKMIFGPALVEAYELESKAAVFPRIVLSDSLLDIARSAHAHHHSPEDEVRSIMSMLTRDTDGMWYIDYLTKGQGELDDPDYGYPTYLLKLSDIVRDGLRSKDIALRLKYQWMREKLSPHIARIKECMMLRTEGDELRDAYLDFPDL
jgi:hypothetical protein